MKLEKLNPWNWFKHEENTPVQQTSIPIARNDYANLVTASPIDTFLALHRQMDRFFDETFRSFGMSSPLSLASDPFWPNKNGTGELKPKTDVSADQNSYEIVLDLPGLTDADVSIELQDKMLTIRGQQESSVESDSKKFYRVERHFGSFQRVLALPEDARGEDISAKMKDGVLTLTIPRVPRQNSDVKRIEIQ